MKKAFWDLKILPWEDRNYNSQRNINKLLSPVNYRQKFAANILKPIVKNKKVLDLGCGSGGLLKIILRCGALKVMGIDLSDAAIDRAKHLNDDQTHFIQGDIADMDWPEADIICGLGILDWLNDHELDCVFEKIRSKKFLLSYSEKRFSFQVIAHRVYVYLLYGWKTNGYMPRYYSEKKITALAKKNGSFDLYFFRHPKLTFGTLITNFPAELEPDGL